jgi:hypothetical protein
MTERKKCDKPDCQADIWAYVGNGTWEDSVWVEEALCKYHAKQALIELHATPPEEPEAP